MGFKDQLSSVCNFACHHWYQITGLPHWAPVPPQTTPYPLPCTCFLVMRLRFRRLAPCTQWLQIADWVVNISRVCRLISFHFMTYFSASRMHCIQREFHVVNGVWRMRAACLTFRGIRFLRRKYERPCQGQTSSECRPARQQVISTSRSRSGNVVVLKSDTLNLVLSSGWQINLTTISLAVPSFLPMKTQAGRRT
jgi:hypothetical protein